MFLSIDPFLCLQTLPHEGEAPKLVAKPALIEKRKVISCGQFYHGVEVQNRPAPAMPSAKDRLAFAVRIRDPSVQKVVQMLRLRKIFSSAFVKMNKTSMAMLKMVEFPILKSVRELGQAKIDKRMVALTDNTLIEQHMGKDQFIVCDLIREIYSVGMNFRVVNNFIWPFKPSVARHAARDKAGLLKDIGKPGPREMDVNSIIRQLN
uniref:Ribosomal protein L7-like 1 n=1 Tax=Hucho hucho TaxID=62062 RepID=A0A4W5QM24_9TELE